MNTKERIALGYVMVACVPYRRLKKGGRIYARAYGKRCFPIWRKLDAKTTKATTKS